MRREDRRRKSAELRRSADAVRLRLEHMAEVECDALISSLRLRSGRCLLIIEEYVRRRLAMELSPQDQSGPWCSRQIPGLAPGPHPCSG